MRNATIVRYQTTAEAADENERLVRVVFSELAKTQPGKLQYMSFRLDDGVTFVHVALVDQSDNPLISSRAFAEFQRDLKSRCVVPPAPASASLIGAYGVALDYGAPQVHPLVDPGSGSG
jgi:hypothetical protein